MGELSCNEVLTSFSLVPNDALEGDGGAGLAGPQTLRFRNGPHAGPNAHVGHVLQHKVRRTVSNVSHVTCATYRINKIALNKYSVQFCPYETKPRKIIYNEDYTILIYE